MLKLSRSVHTAQLGLLPSVPAATASVLAPFPAGTVSVSLQVPYHCKYGQKVCVIGAADYLGAWNVENAVPMNWTEGDVWVADLKLPAQ